MNNLIWAAGFALSFNAVMATPPYPQSQIERHSGPDCQIYDRLLRQCRMPDPSVDEQSCEELPDHLQQCMMGDPTDDQ